MTSLIDVIFLLLLFFMLSSTFSRFGDLPLITASAGTATPDTPPVFLRVTDHALMVDTTEVPLEALRDHLADTKASAVIVAPGSDVSAQRLIDVLMSLRDLPDLPVRVIGG